MSSAAEEPRMRPDCDAARPVGHDHAEDVCAEALDQVQAFLHNELPMWQADLIREHLSACEKCLENFDVEALIGRMVKRSFAPPRAPSTLRVRLTALRVHYPFDE